MAVCNGPCSPPPLSALHMAKALQPRSNSSHGAQPSLLLSCPEAKPARPMQPCSPSCSSERHNVGGCNLGGCSPVPSLAAQQTRLHRPHHTQNRPPAHAPPELAMAAAAQPCRFRLCSVCAWWTASKASSRQPTAGAHMQAHMQQGTIVRTRYKASENVGVVVHRHGHLAAAQRRHVNALQPVL